MIAFYSTMANCMRWLQSTGVRVASKNNVCRMAYEWLTARMSRNFESRLTTSKHAVQRWLKFYSKSSTLSSRIKLYLIFSKSSSQARKFLPAIYSCQLTPSSSSRTFRHSCRPRRLTFICNHEWTLPWLSISDRFSSASPSVSWRRRFHLPSLARPFARLVQYSLFLLRRLNEIITSRFLLLFIVDSRYKCVETRNLNRITAYRNLFYN